MNITNFMSKPERNNNLAKTILLIGNGEFGITNEVIEVSSEEEVFNIYGNGSIYESYKTINNMINNTDKISICVLKPYGNHANATFHINSNGVLYDNALIFKSIFSNQIYNNIQIKISKLCITFVFPIQLNLKPISYYYSDFNTVYSLVNKINNDTLNGLNVIVASVNLINSHIEFDESFYYINNNKYLSNGHSGSNLSDTEKYNNLQTAYELISGLEIDYICLTDVYINDGENYYTQLLRLCIEQLNKGIITLGLISFNNFNNNITSEYIKDFISRLNIENEYIPFKFLIIIISDLLKYGINKNLVNPTAIIALNISIIDGIGNITNKPLGSEFEINNVFNEIDFKLISDSGVICFRNSVFHKSVVVLKGITSCTDNKQFKYITSINMLQNVLPGIKSIAERHLGEDINNLENKRFIDNEIVELLNNNIKINIITSYDFDIKYNLEDAVINYTLILKNAYMTEGIEYVGNFNVD